MSYNRRNKQIVENEGKWRGFVGRIDKVLLGR